LKSLNGLLVLLLLLAILLLLLLVWGNLLLQGGQAIQVRKLHLTARQQSTLPSQQCIHQDQVAALHTTTLSSILCNNFDNLIDCLALTHLSLYD
jgi:hypothetical protein